MEVEARVSWPSMKCNLCFQDVAVQANVTRCGHLLCFDCSRKHFSRTMRGCPKCGEALAGHDVTVVDLNAEAASSMIPYGMPPDVVLEMARKAISFWCFQQAIQDARRRELQGKTAAEMEDEKAQRFEQARAAEHNHKLYAAEKEMNSALRGQLDEMRAQLDALKGKKRKVDELYASLKNEWQKRHGALPDRPLQDLDFESAQVTSGLSALGAASSSSPSSTPSPVLSHLTSGAATGASGFQVSAATTAAPFQFQHRPVGSPMSRIAAVSPSSYPSAVRFAAAAPSASSYAQHQHQHQHHQQQPLPSPISRTFVSVGAAPPPIVVVPSPGASSTVFNRFARAGAETPSVMRPNSLMDGRGGADTMPPMRPVTPGLKALSMRRF